jgi:hypothetical protein
MIEDELFKACENGNLDLVIGLLKNDNIDLNKVNILYDKTPLHIACRNERVEIVKWLIKDGRADVNKVDNNGNTPLLFACQEGCVEIVKVLLEDGRTDVNKVNNDGNAPLHNVCGIVQNVPIIELLLKHGANPFIKNTNYNTTFDLTSTTIKHTMKIYAYMYGHLNESCNLLKLSAEEFQTLRTKAVELLNTPEMIKIFASKIFHQKVPKNGLVEELTPTNMELLINQLKELFAKSNLSVLNSAKKINALKEYYDFSDKQIKTIKSGFDIDKLLTNHDEHIKAKIPENDHDDLPPEGNAIDSLLGQDVD